MNFMCTDENQILKHMKRIFIAACCLFYLGCINVGAQHQTLFNEVHSISGFGGVITTFPSVNGSMMPMTGGGGGVIVNQRFYIGGYGMGSSTDFSEVTNGESYEVDFGHGGFMTGFILWPDRLVHLTLSSRLGWGSIEIANESQNGLSLSDDAVFLINPEIGMEVNVTSWFKINAALGYQLTTGVDNIA